MKAMPTRRAVLAGGFLWLGVALPGLLSSGCAVGSDPAGDAIRLGAVLPLTGAAGWLGEQELIGLEAAAAEYSRPDSGYPPIELRVEDTASQSGRAATAAQKLLDVDGVDALFVTTSAAYKAVAPIADRAGVPLLVMAAEPGLIAEHPTSFRIYMNLEDEVSAMADRIRGTNASAIAIVRLNVEAFAESVKRLRGRLDSGHAIVAEETYEIAARDFRAIAERVGEVQPDLLILLPLGGEFPTLVEQMRQHPALTTVPVLASYTVTGPAAQQRGFELFEGVTFTAFPLGREDPAIREHFEGRETRSGLALSDFLDYAYAYDSVAFLAMAAARRGEGESLLDAMLAVREFEGITGAHALGDREIRIPMRVARYRDGQLVAAE